MLKLNPSMVKFVLALYASVVLAVPNRFLGSSTLRHLYSIIVGAFLLQFAFGGAWLHLLLSSGLVYLTNGATLNIRALDPWRHWTASIFAFAYLTSMHYYRLYTKVDATSVDFLVVQMVLMIKQYTFSYNLHDGMVAGKANRESINRLQNQLTESTLAEKDAKRIRREVKVLCDRQERSLTRLPSLLEYFGFVFNFTSSLVGPAFEISQYLAAQQQGPFPEEALRYAAALKKLAIGVLFMCANLILTAFLPVDRIYTDALNESMPVLQKVIIAHFALMGVRYGYYFVWMLAEASCVLAGYGFHAGKWDAVANVNILEVETATTLTGVMRDWNLHTQSWLERYIFLRSRACSSLTAGLHLRVLLFGTVSFPATTLDLPRCQSSKRLPNNCTLS
jgi:hypothetical protein